MAGYAAKLNLRHYGQSVLAPYPVLCVKDKPGNLGLVQQITVQP